MIIIPYCYHVQAPDYGILMMKNVGSKRLLTLISLCASILLGAAPVYGQDKLLHDEYADSYTVAEGDTLWNIAGQFLQDPQRWEEVWQADPYLDNPGLYISRRYS